MRTPAAIAIALATILGACSKGEPEASRPNAARPVTPPPAVATAPAPSDAGGYAPSDALKERLARQEAAAKLLDAPAPAPSPPPPVPKPAAPAPVAAKAAAAKLPPAATPAPIPAPIAPKAEAPKAEPAPPPRTEVALAKPSSAPAVTRLVTRVEPEFPREAVKAGAYEGNVQARITLDERGNVTRVEVLEARPRRLFDRAVIRALSEWKYNEGAAGRTVAVEIAFKAQ